MNKPFLAGMTLLVALVSLIYSCSKSASAPASKPTNLQLLTSSAWKYDTAGIDGNNSGTITTAIPAGVISDCQKDNLLTFKADSTGIEDEGPTKCKPANPQTTSFTLSFNAAHTKIVLSDTLFSTITGPVNITSLTSSQLRLEKQFSYLGQNFLVAVYLQH